MNRHLYNKNGAIQRKKGSDIKLRRKKKREFFRQPSIERYTITLYHVFAWKIR